MKKYLLGLLFSLFSFAAQAGVTCTLPFNLTNGTTADATQVMANYNALVTCFTNAAASGINTDITALTGLTTPLGPAVGGSNVYIGGTSTGSANVQIVASTAPIGFALTTGYSVVFKAGFTNTAAMTLNVNSTGNTNVYFLSPTGTQVTSGQELQSGSLYAAIYDGTNFVVTVIANQLGGFGPSTTIASATTTDLATAPNHNAIISGVTTITSFGANANTNFPIYRLLFSGSLTLTYNATSLILPGVANIQTAANDTAVAQYLGAGNWQIISYVAASGASPVPATALCGANHLKLINNAGTPTTKIDYTADSAVLLNSGNVSKFVTSVSGTIDMTSVGTVDGVQASRAASTWYDIYFINNGVATHAFAVASATSLAAPSGYTFSCRIGSMVTDGSTNLWSSQVLGRQFQYVVKASGNTQALPNIANGTVGTYSATGPTYTGEVVTGTTYATTNPACMSRAGKIYVVGTNGWNNNGAASWQVAANANYSGSNSVNPPICQVASTTTNDTRVCAIGLESNSIYFASSGAGAGLSTLGCEDAVNAN